MRISQKIHRISIKQAIGSASGTPPIGYRIVSAGHSSRYLLPRGLGRGSPVTTLKTPDLLIAARKTRYNSICTGALSDSNQPLFDAVSSPGAGFFSGAK